MITTNFIPVEPKIYQGITGTDLTVYRDHVQIKFLGRTTTTRSNDIVEHPRVSLVKA